MSVLEQNPMATSCYWNSFRNGYDSKEDVPSDVDVLVVGAGYTGLAAALTVAKGSHSVLVVEKSQLGLGASGMNTGFVTIGTTCPLSTVAKIYGSRAAQEYWDISLESITHLKSILVNEKIDCDYNQNGLIRVAETVTQMEDLTNQYQALEKRLGSNVQLLSSNEIQQEIRSKKVIGGLLDYMSGSLNPIKYLNGLIASNMNYGTKIATSCSVLGIKKYSTHYLVNHSNGSTRARKIIFAADQNMACLPQNIKKIVFPVGSYVIATNPIPSTVLSSCINDRLFTTSYNRMSYFRSTPLGNIIFGGRFSLLPEADLRKCQQYLSSSLYRLFPELQPYGVANVWSGKFGCTRSRLPIFGNEKELYYSMGYCGHGVAMSTWCGTEIAKMACEQESNQFFTQIRHKKLFFERSYQLFLPLMLSWFRIRDIYSNYAYRKFWSL